MSRLALTILVIFTHLASVAQHYVGLLEGDSLFADTACYYTDFQDKEQVIRFASIWAMEEDCAFAILELTENQFSFHTITSKSFKKLRHYRDAVQVKETPYHTAGIVARDGEVRFTRNHSYGDFLFTTATSFESVIAQLERQESQYAAKDNLKGLFAGSYLVTSTRAQLRAKELRDEGHPEQSAFLETMVVAFANRYFNAWNNYHFYNINEVPEVWRHAFDVCQLAETDPFIDRRHVVEVIATTFIAHIVYDLPMALRRIGLPKKRSENYNLLKEFNGILMAQTPNLFARIEHGYGKFTRVQTERFVNQLDMATIRILFYQSRRFSLKNARSTPAEQIDELACRYTQRAAKLLNWIYPERSRITILKSSNLSM